MKKLKLYLDTSFISLLDTSSRPEWTADTLELWDDIINDLYIPIVSHVTFEELEKTPEPKKGILFNYLAQISFQNAHETEESLELVNKYLQHGVLKEQYRDDCRHIALATIVDADCIVSWNFRHFVNINTINKVQAINKLYGYKEIIIISPQMLGGYYE